MSGSAGAIYKISLGLNHHKSQVIRSSSCSSSCLHVRSIFGLRSAWESERNVAQHWLVSSSMRTVKISVGILKFDFLSFQNAMMPMATLLLEAASLNSTHADCTAKHFESGWREQNRHLRMASSRLPGRLRGSLQSISPNFTEHGDGTVCIDRKAIDNRWGWQNVLQEL
jgi:hypothetical protein